MPVLRGPSGLRNGLFYGTAQQEWRVRVQGAQGWRNDVHVCRVLRGGGMTGTIAGCLGVAQ